MQGDNATGHIVVVAVAKAGIFDHSLESFLVRVHTDGLRQILIAVAVFGEQLAELGEYAKRIAVVNFLIATDSVAWKIPVLKVYRRV